MRRFLRLQLRLRMGSSRRTGRVGLVAASLLVLSSCIELASTASDGTQANNLSNHASISGDGRLVAFDTLASNLAPGDVSGSDVFVKDFATGTTTMIRTSPGFQSLFDTPYPVLSADGRYVVFNAVAALVPGDTNGRPDVYRKDLATGAAVQVNTSSTGQPTNGITIGASAVSADGRYVAFWSTASDLVPGDTNGSPDVFVKDLATGATTRVSTDSAGGQATDVWNGLFPGISADGRYVAFTSIASNLVPGDTNGAVDVFVKDRTTGATTRVSTDSSGAQVAGGSGARAISADGRYVAFVSGAANLVPGDTNGVVDVFVKDRTTGATTRISTSSGGAQATGSSRQASISADGRYVSFESDASNLVSGDTNGTSDVFVKDRTTGATTRANVGSDGAQADDAARESVISADGQYVVFESGATNLVDGDVNGFTDVFRATRP